MGGEGPPPAELMAPEGHKREREAEKAGASYSGTGLGVPEAPRGGRRGRQCAVQVRPRSAGSAHALRTGRARAEVPGFGTHADYGGGGEHGAAENGACAWFLWAGLVFGWAGRSLDFKFESRVFGSFGGTG